jgi:gamma-tubulin complex component 5
VELELLYEAVCESQAAGDASSYKYMGDLFFESLQAYLRPVRMWMEEGAISIEDDFFFIQENTEKTEASSIWHDRFTLRQAPDGSLLAPKFLHPAGLLILNTGKSIVFLQRLGILRLESLGPEPVLDFDSICSSTAQSYLAPFPALFGGAFDDWIRSKHGPSSAILLRHLFNNCQLWRSLNALEEVYFAKDGTRLQELADTIFEKLDSRRIQSWNDRYLLSELIQNVFTGSDSVDAGRLSVRTVHTKSSPRSIKALSSIVIDYNVGLILSLSYILSNLI